MTRRNSSTGEGMTDEENDDSTERKPSTQETPADDAETEQGKQLDEGTETPG